MENQEIRAAARQKLQGKWGTPILVSIVYSLLISGLAMLSIYFQFIQETQSIASALSNMNNLVSFIIGGPLALGLIGFFLKFSRDQEYEFNDLFEGFKSFGTAFLLNLLIGIFVLLWTLLFIIPGIVAGYRYALSFYILKDNPQFSATEALNESKRLMDGYKMDLFMLGLSFLGWVLLCLLSLGIGFIWLAPYSRTSYALFYEQRILADQAQNPTKENEIS